MLNAAIYFWTLTRERKHALAASPNIRFTTMFRVGPKVFPQLPKFLRKMKNFAPEISSFREHCVNRSVMRQLKKRRVTVYRPDRGQKFNNEKKIK